MSQLELNQRMAQLIGWSLMKNLQFRCRNGKTLLIYAGILEADFLELSHNDISKRLRGTFEAVQVIVEGHTRFWFSTAPQATTPKQNESSGW